MRQLELKLAVRCLNERQMNTSIRRTVLIALSLSAVSLCAWIVFIGSAGRPIDRRVSIVSLSRTGKWLAAGTAQGKITVWDQESKFLTREESYTRQHLFVQVAESNGLLQNMSLRCDRYTNLQKTKPAGRPGSLHLCRSERRWV